MRLLERLLSRRRRRAAAAAAAAPADPRALARYRYLVHTAPPATLERIHREAFRRMSAPERAEALRRLEAVVPAYERLSMRGDGAGTDPATLARLATRAELRQPGSLLLAFGEHRATGLFPGGLMTRLMGGALASVLAQALLDRGAFEREASAGAFYYARGEDDALRTDADDDGGDAPPDGAEAPEGGDEDSTPWAADDDEDSWDDRSDDDTGRSWGSGLEDAPY